MNITHAKKEEVNGDMLEVIFNRQKELMEKYHDIESRSGLVQTEDCPVNLDDKKGQARIKDFSWRVMEELGEALDAVNDEDHHVEELIDGLHFLTELTILSGMTEEEVVSGLGCCSENSDKLCVLSCESSFKEKFGVEDITLEENVIIFVREIGMMCNCLKNKPWKQSHMKTDRAAFYSRLQNVWVSYLHLLRYKMPVEGIVEVYLKKSQVNKFRQRSNY